MSRTTTGIMTEHGLLSSPTYLGSSVSSVTSSRKSSSSSSRHHRHSEYSRAYKTASYYFLIRRFGDSYRTLKPIVDQAHLDDQISPKSKATRRPPISNFDRKLRVKVWSLYLTLLNSLAELGFVQACDSIGKTEWKRLSLKLENASIWDEVLRIGYGGKEAALDPEIAVNLVNLLLARAKDQKRTKDLLEAYLAVAGNASATEDDLRSSMSSHQSNDSSSGITNLSRSPKGLELYLQMLELYILHVLPANNEWPFARDFVKMNDLLDDERKDALLEALDELEEGGNDQHDRSSHSSASLPFMKRLNGLPSHVNDMSRTDSEMTIRPSPAMLNRRMSRETQVLHGFESRAGLDQERDQQLRSVAPAPVEEPSGPLRKRPDSLRPSRPQHQTLSNGQGSRADPSPQPPPSTLISRSLSAIMGMSTFALNISRHLSRNPATLLRFVVFLLAFVAALSRRQWRARLQRTTRDGWMSVKRTVGMGMKVSYV